MEQLKAMKEQMISVVQAQLCDIKNVDATELGEAVDVIKNLSDAMKLCEEEKYYKTITEAMKKQDKEDPRTHYYNQMYLPYGDYPPEPMYYADERDMDRYMGRMYYHGQPRDSQGRFENPRMDSSNPGSSSTGIRMYHEHEFPIEMRDRREGRSGMSRRMYMESKEMHKDKSAKIKDLENYMKELSEDLVEMIQDASPEEKQLLEKKMTALATKVAQLPNA